MIQEGQKKRARYRGDYTVQKVAKLKSPIHCHSEEVGEVEFMPTLVKIDWAVSPSLDKNEFWFPYWVKIKGKEKYGQFAPMIGQEGLLQLLQEAINQDFFSSDFSIALDNSIVARLDQQRQVRDKSEANKA